MSVCARARVRERQRQTERQRQREGEDGARLGSKWYPRSEDYETAELRKPNTGLMLNLEPPSYQIALNVLILK